MQAADDDGSRACGGFVLPELRRCRHVPVVLGQPGPRDRRPLRRARGAGRRHPKALSRLAGSLPSSTRRHDGIDAARAVRVVPPGLCPSRRGLRQPGPLDIVGPICREQRRVPRGSATRRRWKSTDLVAPFSTPAHGAVMASNYNRRMLAPEVLVDAGEWRAIRRRQTLDDVLALESQKHARSGSPLEGLHQSGKGAKCKPSGLRIGWSSAIALCACLPFPAHDADRRRDRTRSWGTRLRP